MRLCETQPISSRQVYCTKSKGLFDLCGQAQPQTFWESEEIDRLMVFIHFVMLVQITRCYWLLIIDSGTRIFSDTMQFQYCFLSTIDNRPVSGTYIYVKIQYHRYIQNGIHSEIQQNWYMYIVIMIQRDWCMYSYLQIQQSWCMYSYLEKQQSWYMYTVITIQCNWCTQLSTNTTAGACIQLVTDTMVQVYLYSYYRFNRTSSCIVTTDTMELVHVYSYLEKQQN